MQSTTTRDNAQTVKVFSPRDNVPAALADMSTDAVWQHIQHARRLIEHHEDIARNGDEGAAVYYFYIPEVAQELANARYTLTVCFSELARRKAESETQTTTAPLAPVTVMVTPSWRFVFYPGMTPEDARTAHPDTYHALNIEPTKMEIAGAMVNGVCVQLSR